MRRWAFAIAAERWAGEGTPAHPRAWLVTTARNRAIDRIRRDRTLAAKAHLLETPTTTEDEVDATTITDERLGFSSPAAIRRSRSTGRWR